MISNEVDYYAFVVEMPIIDHQEWDSADGYADAT